MLWPNGTTTKPYVTSSFGPRNISTPGASKDHKGVDLVGFSAVKAVAAGTVTLVGRRRLWERGGYMVWIQHDGFLSRSLHLRENSSPLRVGQKVAEGQTIGTMGASGILGVGSPGGVHLHLEIVYGGIQVDPVPFIESRLARPAGGGSSIIPAPGGGKRRRRNMSTAVVITDHKADKDRQGVILDSENNLVSRFGWFPLAYGHQVAKGFGLEQAAVATPGHFNVIVADATARAEASGKVQVKGEVAIVGEG